MNAKLSFMLDVRRLRVLHAVSAYGSVTAAAAALGYSAPAVSQQLAALEREVGMRLTERAGRGVSLTPAALILVAHTDEYQGGRGELEPSPTPFGQPHAHLPFQGGELLGYGGGRVAERRGGRGHRPVRADGVQDPEPAHVEHEA